MNPFYELAMKLIGLNPDNDSDFQEAEEKIGNQLFEKYEITEENFEKLMRDLVKFTPIIKSEMTEELYHGFVDKDNAIILYKEEVK